LETSSQLEITEYIVKLYLKLNYAEGMFEYGGIQYNLSIMWTR